MGTGKLGRNLRKDRGGSYKKVNAYALVHSNEGTFTYTNQGHHISRVRGGCHGQDGIRILEKSGVVYNIVKTYSNGVRVGNIPNHKNPFKRKGIGQSWFPKSWNAYDIKKAGEHVAKLKGFKDVPNGVKFFGVYRGVRVGIIKEKGKIQTIFPDSNQDIYLRRKNKK